MGRMAKEGLYKRKDSLIWQYRLYDQQGKLVRSSTGEKDEDKALRFYLQEKSKVEVGTFSLEASKIKIKTVLQIYHDNHGKHSKSSGYQYARKKLLDYFADTKWRVLNDAKVQRYKQHRLKVDEVSKGTINKELVMLSAAANYVIQYEEIPLHNPVAGKKFKEIKKQYYWLSEDEAKNLIKAASSEPKAEHLQDYIIISLSTGMRSGEVLGLQLDHIDLNKSIIYLPTTKSEQPHEIPITDSVLAAIERRLKFIKKHLIFTKWLFCHENGNQIKSVKRSFKTACRRAGIPITDQKKGIQGFRMHDQRHTTASWLVSKGVPLYKVQDLLNHASIKTTERYAHLAPDARGETVSKLPKL